MLKDGGQVRQKLCQESEKTRHLAAQAVLLIIIAPIKNIQIEFPSGRKHFSGHYSTFYATPPGYIG